MKKRLIGMIVIAILGMELVACGKEVVPTNYEDMETASQKDRKKQSLLEKAIETAIETGTNPSGQTPKESGSKVELGGEFQTDYDGFSYLYCEELMTESTENEETGKMENQKLSVFIPNGDYASVNRDTAYSEELGVDFRVSLNPTIRYEEENYLVSENLKYFLDYEYDAFYCTDYYNLHISEIESVSDGARAYVSYCYYDKWNDKYSLLFATYYLKEVSKDVTVLVEVKVDSEEVTGKTPSLLAELKSFYGFHIEWDEQEAKNMLDQFLANYKQDTKSFSTGYLLFDLPSEWDRDYENEEGTEYVFAPGGDAAFAGCMILFNREYLGSEVYDITDICSSQESIDAYKKYLQEIWGDIVSNIEITEYGKTCMGNAIKITFQTKDGDYEDTTEWYTITDDDYIYSMEVIALPDCDRDVFAIAETILTNGVLKE
ncbi:MAG TPA: hypothetical protein VJY54_06375 [Lachnospiraceae bacterium]|nr:hypothetical protein [Lachnospiraceae bacterium]